MCNLGYAYSRDGAFYFDDTLPVLLLFDDLLPFFFAVGKVKLKMRLGRIRPLE